jgi:hypothetical protein
MSYRIIFEHIRSLILIAIFFPQYGCGESVEFQFQSDVIFGTIESHSINSIVFSQIVQNDSYNNCETTVYDSATIFVRDSLIILSVMYNDPLERKKDLLLRIDQERNTVDVFHKYVNESIRPIPPHKFVKSTTRYNYFIAIDTTNLSSQIYINLWNDIRVSNTLFRAEMLGYIGDAVKIENINNTEISSVQE